MTEFRVGDKVALDGEHWEEVPKQGQIVTIERLVWAEFDAVTGGVGAFTLGGEEWFVWGEAGHSFHGTVVEPSQVGTRGIGHLDGLLGLPPVSNDDEYLLGHMRGAEVRERGGDS